MTRPSITLACIMKNEEENLPRLMESVKDCFDEVIFTDTGSTDNSVEVAKHLGATVKHFEWVNDFAAARNASFEPVKTDYVMWLDLDDVLENKQGFLNFRNDAMGLCDYWMATYHYASDATGKPVCSFARERVFKREKGMRWKYFVHEGVIPESPYGPIKINFTPVWAVKHMRTDADLLKDRSRNLDLFKAHSDLDARQTYYYGKELFEAQMPKDAIVTLGQALSMPNLEIHDRTIGMQYLCYAYMQENQFDKAMELAHAGLMLAPHRAEFHTIIGDCFLKMGRMSDAIPSYAAAKACQPLNNSGQPSAIFSNEETYTTYPRNQLARIYANMGDLDRSEREAVESVDRFTNAESTAILAEVRKMKGQVDGFKNATPCEDITIVCPPTSPYLWDGNIYRQKAMGGSETAAIEMAEWLHKLSGRPVKIFNARESVVEVNGVEYIPTSQVSDYMAKHKPWININWRHNFKITDAPTFLWCHDLITPGAENTANYEKLLCLTPFHKRYAMATQGIPLEKIHVTRNGIKPDRFKDGKTDAVNPFAHLKDPYKFVYGSSPDRGLDRTMRVLDKVRERYPAITLSIHYGISHLDSYGLKDLRIKLEEMIEERKEWVTYHGPTQQDELMKSYKSAAYCLQPSDFIETSMISAMELICCGTYPIMRKLGGVTDTLGKAVSAGMATLVDSDCITEREYEKYIEATIDAIENERWMDVSVNPDELSWENVAKDWLRDLPELIEGVTDGAA